MVISKIKQYISLIIIFLTLFIMGYYIGKNKQPKIITKQVIIKKKIYIPDTSLIDSLNILKKTIWKLKHQIIKPDTVYISTTDTILDTIIQNEYGIEKGIWKIEKERNKLSLIAFLKKQNYYFPFKTTYDLHNHNNFIIIPTSDTLPQNAFKVILIRQFPIHYTIQSELYYDLINKEYGIGLNSYVNYKRVGIHIGIFNSQKNFLIPIGITFKLREN